MIFLQAFMQYVEDVDKSIIVSYKTVSATASLKLRVHISDWQVIVQQYKEDNVYLAEAAHMLMANVNFEIPALKRQMGKCQTLQQESSRKEQDCISSSSTYREKYHQHCKEIR